MVVGTPLYGHSTRILLLASTSLTFTWTDKLYISHVHVTDLPASNFPLLLVNQNLVVIWGSTKASNTFATGLRMSISTLALGAVVRWRCVVIFNLSPSF